VLQHRSEKHSNIKQVKAMKTVYANPQNKDQEFEITMYVSEI